ncbi:MAG: hypothetical protein WEB88_04625 [Gemmatimonadota bacterium]
MTTREDIESYLIRMDAQFDEVDEGMWRLEAEDAAPVVVHFSPPVVLLRMKVLDLPTGGGEGALASLYRKLLELNATDIVHGSYGIEGGEVILSDTLQLEDLDFSELRSSYESLAFAASQHMGQLSGLVPAAQEG